MHPLRNRQHAHRPGPERLDGEPQGLELGLEVPYLGGKLRGQPDDDEGGEIPRRPTQVLLKLLVQDALVCAVLVQDDELVALLGNRKRRA
ncbi:MAG: hypothetical protein M3P37_11535 [Actinomycetota bacterium]|nr:hypothetical protein [Actinomycetota bacterium]